ncbi:MAG: hypothetical protein HPY53_05320 [Brevinematales bacterium]|nr:hypothetical protein [Brevinematales bacterium]
MNAVKKIMTVVLFTVFYMIGFSNTSHSAMLLFKGKGFFLMNMKMDMSNILVNPFGTGQPLLTSSSFLKIDLYPTYEDKNFKSELKIKINPYATGTDYLLADGFNFIYDTDSANIAIFVNRYGFRFHDPMFTGIEQYNWENSKYSYDRPVYFSYNNSVQTPAFYEGEKVDDRFLKLGYGLTGIYLGSKGDLSYEIAAYLNKWQTSSHIQADVAYDMGLLKAGVIFKLDNHPNSDVAKGAAYNLTNVFDGLVQRYNNAFVTYSAGLFGNVNLEVLNIFFEGVYRTGTGMPGVATNTSKNGLIDIYAGVGSDIIPGSSIEVATLYRMYTPGTDYRMDIMVKDYNALDFGDVQLFLLANVVIFSGKFSSTDLSGMGASLSARIPMFDLITLRVAATYESYTISTNNTADLVLKATVDYYFDETSWVYAGIVMYNLMKFNGLTAYEPSYFLPVVGFVSSPFESLRLSLTFGYNVEVFEYDNSGANMENIVSKSIATVPVGAETQVYSTDWLKMVANPSVNFTANIIF